MISELLMREAPQAGLHPPLHSVQQEIVLEAHSPPPTPQEPRTLDQSAGLAQAALGSMARPRLCQEPKVGIKVLHLRLCAEGEAERISIYLAPPPAGREEESHGMI